MPRDPRAYLWDAREAAGHALEFVRGKSFEEFGRELLLRSAVERQLEVLGEALSQLAKVAPDLAQQVPCRRERAGRLDVARRRRARWACSGSACRG
jgi:uncharacterized protein with HEPN domain